MQPSKLRATDTIPFKFQSSPAREGECNAGSPFEVSPLTDGFNPHPPMRASATLTDTSYAIW